MSNLRYIILEKTPFPGHWQPLALHMIQDAEYALFSFTDKHYEQRAINVSKSITDKLLSYQYQDAMSILEYCQQSRPFGEYKLLAVQVDNSL